MRRKKWKHEQIIEVLKAAEAPGASIQEVCRVYGVGQSCFYRWRQKYEGLQVSEARRLKELEDENRRLKSLVADLTLDNQALKGLLGKKW